LRDENERRRYDLIYPSLKGKANPFQGTREANTTFVPKSTINETAQIAALRKLKQERAAQWWISKMAFDTSIFEAERVIRRLKLEINGLMSILAAEAAEEAQKNSWGTWLLSPIFKKAEDGDEVKARKDRARQERRIERDMKERRLEKNREELKTTKARMEKSKAEIDAANVRDDAKIQELQTTIWRKESWQRQERERAEREKRAEVMRQQQEQRERKEREAAEARRRQEAAARLAKQQREEEEARRWQKRAEEFSKWEEELRKPQNHSSFTDPAEMKARKNASVTCQHDGWWPKVQGRAACPECHDSWTYLLQCPGCAMKACPKCQAAVRPRRPNNAARTDRRARPRMRAPSPSPYDDDYYW
jgi:hypothetical protein